MSGGLAMDKSRFVRSVATVSFWTGVSRLLGFVREVVMAYFFGTSLAKSAFDVAFKIPNLFRRLFGEGALSAAFVPVFSETLEKEGLDRAGQLANKVMTMLAVSLGTTAVGVVLLLTVVIHTVALGETMTAVLPLLRIMFPYMLFICLVALCMGILNSMGHFALPAATPVVLNVVWIAALLFLCPLFGESTSERIYGAAWGILAAGVIQLTIQMPVLLHRGFRPRVSWAWRDPNVQRILSLMGPAAVGMGITQVNVVIDGLLAVTVGPWAPAALTYAERLIYLPLGLFATALGTVLLPTFSRQAARAQDDEIRATVGMALRSLLFVMMPAALGLIVLARPIVDLAFLWRGGEFTAQSSLYTTRAVWFYAPGLVLFSLHKVFVPAFYAMQDTRTPVRVGIRVVGLNLALNILFILTWPADFKHAGLAMATVIASGVSSVTLAVILQRRIGSPGWLRIGGSAVRILGASIAMAIAAKWCYGWLAAACLATGPSASGVSKLGQLAAVGGGVGAGLAVYLVVSLLLCRSEWQGVLRAFRARSPMQD